MARTFSIPDKEGMKKVQGIVCRISGEGIAINIGGEHPVEIENLMLSGAGINPEEVDFGDIIEAYVTSDDGLGNVAISLVGEAAGSGASAAAAVNLKPLEEKVEYLTNLLSGMAETIVDMSDRQKKLETDIAEMKKMLDNKLQ